MKFLQNKVVLITGAGFSAPAKLPIQDRILKEMVQPPEPDFLRANPNEESVKFLFAYIKVSLYLLKEYGNCDVAEVEDDFNKLTEAYAADNRVQEVLKYIEETKVEEAQQKDFNINNILDEVADKFIIDDTQFFYELLAIKEKLRGYLFEKNVQVSLEDVFTAFDKSMAMRENTSNFTYAQMDDLQHAVLRLFIYYFSKRVNQHEYTHPDYEFVVKYLKRYQNNISIITTNWDVLLEKYLENASVKYNYPFNSSYVVNSEGELYKNIVKREMEIPYIKVHGSINWFRCLRCGTLQVSGIPQCGAFLFDDAQPEKCLKCGQVGYGSNILIRPEIITPTMLKSINGQLYNNLWQNAAYELQKANKIIFCGYSLPIADFEFRHLLKQNVNSSVEIDVVLHTNDNPEVYLEKSAKKLLPEKRFKDLFANNKCSFYYNGFGDYFRKTFELKED